MQNFYRHLHQPSPIFTGSQKVGKFSPIFDPLAFQALWLKMEQFIKIPKNTPDAQMIG